LGQAALWKGGTDLLVYGISIALMIAALAYFQGQRHGNRKENPGAQAVDTEEH
jgi:hypothetical protein